MKDYAKHEYLKNIEVNGTVSDYTKDIVTFLGLIGIVIIIGFLISLI